MEIVEKEMSNIDFNARMKELMSEFIDLTAKAHTLEKQIQEDWKKNCIKTVYIILDNINDI